MDSSDDSGLSAVDETWLDDERTHYRSSSESGPVGSPVVGGVGAAAAAALQRFQGQQAERARENQERAKSGPLPGPSQEAKAARGGDMRSPGQYVESRLSGVDQPGRDLKREISLKQSAIDDAWNPPAPVQVPPRTWEPPPEKELQWSRTLPAPAREPVERPGHAHQGQKNGWNSFDGDLFGGGSGAASPDMFSPVFQNVGQRFPQGADYPVSPHPPEAMAFRPRSPPPGWAGDAVHGGAFAAAANGTNFGQQGFPAQQGGPTGVPELSPFTSLNLQANGGEQLRLAQQTAASPPAQQFLSPQQYPQKAPFQQQFALPQYQPQQAQFQQYQQAPNPQPQYQQQATTPPQQYQNPPLQQQVYQQPQTPPQQQYMPPVQYPPPPQQFQQPYQQAAAPGGQFQQAINPPTQATPQQQVVQLGQQLRVEKPPAVHAQFAQPPWNQNRQTAEVVGSPLAAQGGATDPDSWTVPGSMSESSAWETFGEQNKPKNEGGGALQQPFQPQPPQPLQHRRSSSQESRIETALPPDWEISFSELTLGPKIGQVCVTLTAVDCMEGEEACFWVNVSCMGVGSGIVNSLCFRSRSCPSFRGTVISEACDICSPFLDTLLQTIPQSNAEFQIAS
jgi:hypothetical protein